MTDALESFEALKRGTVEVLLEQDLKKKLATGRPLRVSVQATSCTATQGGLSPPGRPVRRSRSASFRHGR